MNERNLVIDITFVLMYNFYKLFHCYAFNSEFYKTLHPKQRESDDRCVYVHKGKLAPKKPFKQPSVFWSIDRSVYKVIFDVSLFFCDDTSIISIIFCCFYLNESFLKRPLYGGLFYIHSRIEPLSLVTVCLFHFIKDTHGSSTSFHHCMLQWVFVYCLLCRSCTIEECTLECRRLWKVQPSLEQCPYQTYGSTCYLVHTLGDIVYKCPYHQTNNQICSDLNI